MRGSNEHIHLALVVKHITLNIAWQNSLVFHPCSSAAYIQYCQTSQD